MPSICADIHANYMARYVGLWLCSSVVHLTTRFPIHPYPHIHPPIVCDCPSGSRVGRSRRYLASPAYLPMPRLLQTKANDGHTGFPPRQNMSISFLLPPQLASASRLITVVINFCSRHADRTKDRAGAEPKGKIMQLLASTTSPATNPVVRGFSSWNICNVSKIISKIIIVVVINSDKRAVVVLDDTRKTEDLSAV